MPNEIEPTLPDGEQNADSHELLTQEWIIEGLVVATDKSHPQYLVTNVLAGHDTVYPGEYSHQQLRSPNQPLALAPENFSEYSYRGLTSKRYYRRHTDLYYDDPDYLLEANAVVNVGDRIRVTRWSQEIPYEYDAWGGGKGISSTTEYTENVTVLEIGIDIDTEEDRVLKQKKYIRKNFAGILRRLEQLQLQKRERLQTNVDTAITWDHDGQDKGAVARYVYGEGSIKDHFVTLSAEPYNLNNEVPLPGDLRFTQSGRSFLQRNIAAGGAPNELTLVNEPFLELSASVWTDTAYNPEVDNVRVDYIIDGVRYVGSIDSESSTRSFRSPGHHLEFKNFSDTTVEYDGVEIKSDETEAIFKYQDIVRKLRFQTSRAGIKASHTQKELGDASFTDIVPAQSLLQELQLVSQEAYKDIQPIVEQINARPSDTKFGGVRLLIPRSKLASVRVVIYQTIDRR